MAKKSSRQNVLLVPLLLLRVDGVNKHDVFYKSQEVKKEEVVKNTQLQ